MTPILHIGYLKTGTNWLQEEFFADPATGYRWLDKRPATHPVNLLIRARPLDFDAAAIRRESEPLIESAAKAADLPPARSFRPTLRTHVLGRASTARRSRTGSSWSSPKHGS